MATSLLTSPAGQSLNLFGEVVSSSGGPSPKGGAPGLSLAHKCTQGEESWAYRIAEGGEFLQVVSPSVRGRPGGGGQRGTIKGFSRSSRKAGFDRIKRIDRRGIKCVFFMTLTVPKGEGDWKSIERWRRAYFARFRRHWGASDWACWWRKEPHMSGEPHLHLLLFWYCSPPDLADFRAWNDAAWAGVVKSENPHHQAVGCNVQKMRGWSGVCHYVAKYLTKEQEYSLGEGTGRIWGVENRAVLKECITEESCSEYVGKQVRRAGLRLSRRLSRRWFARLPGQRAVSVRSAIFSVGLKPKTGIMDSAFVPVLREKGYKCFQRAMKCGRNVKEDIWGYVESDTVKQGRGKMVKIGQETTFYPFSSVYVNAAAAHKLVDHYVSAYRREREGGTP